MSGMRRVLGQKFNIYLEPFRSAHEFLKGDRDGRQKAGDPMQCMHAGAWGDVIICAALASLFPFTIEPAKGA